jgi:hypothetical protein
MTGYTLHADRYVQPTPAGAYYVASQAGGDPVHRLLSALLRAEATPLLTQASLEQWTGQAAVDAQESLYHAQHQQWIEGFPEPRSSREGALEAILPDLLPLLADSGKALLADAHGFYVAAAGFTHEAAVELSALSADLASLDARHGALTRRNLRLAGGAWAVVDAAGNSQLGFWPLFVDDHRFALVLQGVPHFNQPAFTELVWALSRRYAGHQG